MGGKGGGKLTPLHAGRSEASLAISPLYDPLRLLLVLYSLRKIMDQDSGFQPMCV
jgi:hypothetical protein